jgi:hypothetical protein
MVPRTNSKKAPRMSIHKRTRPTVTVGVRFHDPKLAVLFERCLACLGAQIGVRVHVVIATQGFKKADLIEVQRHAEKGLDGSGFSYEILNISNRSNRDLRSKLLNKILDLHYEKKWGPYLAFIDFDDIWFSHALETLIEPLKSGNFAMSYADIHCADVYYDKGQVYLRGIRDHFKISQKVKRNLQRENFLPLHSYLFHTDRIDRELLRYDENLTRLEDYDVLLRVARSLPISGLQRESLIGLYNFYTFRSGFGNSTENIFNVTEKTNASEGWTKSLPTISARHSGKPWMDFCGEEWLL